MNFSKLRAPDSTRTRFKIRQTWIDHAQARRDLSPSERLIAGRLALHQNLQTGRCNPGIRTLADEAGMCERSAFRAIVGLERKGLIAVSRDPSRGGRSHANRYRLLPPNVDSTSSFIPAETLTAEEAETLTTATVNADSVSAELREQDSKDNTLRVLSLLGERDGHASRDDPPPIRAAARLTAAAPGEDQEQESSLSPTKASLPSKPVGPKKTPSERGVGPPAPAKTSQPSEPSLPNEEFAELQRIWSVRPWPDTPKDIAAAERAYLLAAAEVGDNAILAGARATVAAPAYRGEKARYLKPLGKWLLERGWAKPPPQPAPSPPRQQRGYRKQLKPDLARMMLALGEKG